MLVMLQCVATSIVKVACNVMCDAAPCAPLPAVNLGTHNGQLFWKCYHVKLDEMEMNNLSGLFISMLQIFHQTYKLQGILYLRKE